MQSPTFSIGEAIRFGWTTVTRNLGLFVLAVMIVLGINMLPALFDRFLILITVLVWGLDIAVGLGFMRMVLRFVDGEKGELVDLFSAFHLIIGYFVASIIVSLVVGVAFLFLILPGIWVGIRLMLYGWVIADREVGPFAALDASWAITRGAFWQLFGLLFTLFFVNLLGLLALGIGLLVTGPLSVVAIAYAYRRLEATTE